MPFAPLNLILMHCTRSIREPCRLSSFVHHWPRVQTSSAVCDPREHAPCRANAIVVTTFGHPNCPTPSLSHVSLNRAQSRVTYATRPRVIASKCERDVIESVWTRDSMSESVCMCVCLLWWWEWWRVCVSMLMCVRVLMYGGHMNLHGTTTPFALSCHSLYHYVTREDFI